MELFSYHLIDAGAGQVFRRLLSSRALKQVDGLLHFECLLTMKMGRSVLSPSRFNYRTLAFFAWWRDAAALDAFLANPPYAVFRRPAWYIRMRFYRRWGTYAALDDAQMYREHANPEGPVVGITFAKLKLSQTFRFARWGKPVERQVRDHPGQVRAAVSFRPVRTFSTFSVWESEADMIGMVRGMQKSRDGVEHQRAMVERARKPFHFEFVTMRFVPISEHGAD